MSVLQTPNFGGWILYYPLQQRYCFSGSLGDGFYDWLNDICFVHGYPQNYTKMVIGCDFYLVDFGEKTLVDQELDDVYKQHINNIGSPAEWPIEVDRSKNRSEDTTCTAVG